MHSGNTGRKLFERNNIFDTLFSSKAAYFFLSLSCLWQVENRPQARDGIFFENTRRKVSKRNGDQRIHIIHFLRGKLKVGFLFSLNLRISWPLTKLNLQYCMQSFFCCLTVENIRDNDKMMLLMQCDDAMYSVNAQQTPTLMSLSIDNNTAPAADAFGVFSYT